MDTKEAVLRDLEYVCGGLDALRVLIENNDDGRKYRQLFDDWKDILYNVVNLVEGCDINAENS